MAFRVRLTERASEDAERIYEQIIIEAPLRGHEWYNRLFAALDSLAEMPERCPIARNLSPRDQNIRFLLYGTYKIYFRVVGNVVEVMHLRHARRRGPSQKKLRR